MKINFRYSMPYDEMLSIMRGEELSHSQAMIAKDYIARVNELWDGEGREIIKEIERAAGLRFKQDVDCYIVSEMAFEAISHPFTLKMCSNFEKLRGILVHELLHVLFVQNDKKILPVLNNMAGEHSYRVHFPVLVCERRVLERLYKEFKIEKRVEDLDNVWKDVNKIYPGFKNYRKGVIEFLRENAAC